uniref:Uncharacterized protein n=1 Tax=Pristionchus pacificus TaxID=54126 RepID=A0A2A6CXL1_PRIPA|eukprot:PDM82840.1 hypothetical protein PRIPAC_37233 [Pristionchus pacificus]
MNTSGGDSIAIHRLNATRIGRLRCLRDGIANGLKMRDRVFTIQAEESQVGMVLIICELLTGGTVRLKKSREKSRSSHTRRNCEAVFVKARSDRRTPKPPSCQRCGHAE